jgi:hypothetical protein
VGGGLPANFAPRACRKSLHAFTQCGPNAARPNAPTRKVVAHLEARASQDAVTLAEGLTSICTALPKGEGAAR